MGFIDRATADYLQSQAPDPTQQSIGTLLDRVTRIRVVPVGNHRQGTTELKTLLETSNPASLAAFRACLLIHETPETFGHCMCFGDPHIELYAGDEQVATIGYHHSVAIRWDAWKHDARLKEPNRLLDWMSAHGVDGPRREVEEARRRSEDSRLQAEQWLEDMPDCFRPYWERMDHERDPELHRELLKALGAAIPDPEGQALSLLGWFGGGSGPWSGYPSYEGVPEQLLLHYPTRFLVGVLLASSPTETQWRGAARYFCGWDFQQQKKGDRSQLPSEINRRLLQAARSTGLADNIVRSERALRV